MLLGGPSKPSPTIRIQLFWTTRSRIHKEPRQNTVLLSLVLLILAALGKGLWYSRVVRTDRRKLAVRGIQVLTACLTSSLYMYIFGQQIWDQYKYCHGRLVCDGADVDTMWWWWISLGSPIGILFGLDVSTIARLRQDVKKLNREQPARTR